MRSGVRCSSAVRLQITNKDSPPQGRLHALGKWSTVAEADGFEWGQVLERRRGMREEEGMREHGERVV